MLNVDDEQFLQYLHDENANAQQWFDEHRELVMSETLATAAEAIAAGDEVSVVVERAAR